MNDVKELVYAIRQKQLFPVLRDFKAEAIPYAQIKGDVLSIQAYGRSGMRESTDIDILISKDNIEKVRTILNRYGFIEPPVSRKDQITLLSCSHQLKPFYKSFPLVGDIIVDVNFDVLWGELQNSEIDMDDFLSDTVPMMLHGYEIQTLPLLKALIQLALHHYKEMNSIYLLATQNTIRIDMFQDIYFLIKNNSHIIRASDLANVCKKYRIIQYVFYIVYYTQQIFKDSMLDDYVDALKTTDGINILNCYGLNESERREWKCDFYYRLNSDTLYNYIAPDLTDRDLEKILINKRLF